MSVTSKLQLCFIVVFMLALSFGNLDSKPGRVKPKTCCILRNKDK